MVNKISPSPPPPPPKSFSPDIVCDWLSVRYVDWVLDME